MKFFKTYDSLPSGAREFRKKTTIHAIQMNDNFAVVTLEGRVEGKVGDWLAKGVKGELYPIAEDVFEKTYQTLDDKDSLGIDPYKAWNNLKRWVREKKGIPISQSEFMEKMQAIEQGK